jgi:hypothetical protein
MTRRASNDVVASTKPDVECVNAREVDNHEVLLNSTGAGARRAPVTQLDNQTELL